MLVRHAVLNNKAEETTNISKVINVIVLILTILKVIEFWFTQVNKEVYDLYNKMPIYCLSNKKKRIEIRYK
jgi:hypothetical protein